MNGLDLRVFFCFFACYLFWFSYHCLIISIYCQGWFSRHFQWPNGLMVKGQNQKIKCTSFSVVQRSSGLASYLGVVKVMLKVQIIPEIKTRLDRYKSSILIPYHPKLIIFVLISNKYCYMCLCIYWDDSHRRQIDDFGKKMLTWEWLVVCCNLDNVYTLLFSFSSRCT